MRDRCSGCNAPRCGGTEKYCLFCGRENEEFRIEETGPSPEEIKEFCSDHLANAVDLAGMGPNDIHFCGFCGTDLSKLLA